MSFMLAILGALLLIIGGFISKPRYLWIGAVVVGLVYISSFYGIVSWWLEKNQMVGFIYPLIPGLACIVVGVVMWKLSRGSSKANPPALKERVEDIEGARAFKRV